MFLLAIDTSTPVISVALVRDDTVVRDAARGTLSGPQLHGELLAPLIAEVMGAHAFTELDAVAVGLGPGPYTGLRVGIVTAETIAHVAGVPVWGVGSLDAIALGARMAGVDVPLTAVIDVKRKELGFARYAVDSNRPVTPPAVMKAVDLAALGEEFAGSGLCSYPDLFDPLAYAQPPGAAAIGLLAIARAAAGEDQPPVPLYLRHPDVALPGGRA